MEKTSVQKLAGVLKVLVTVTFVCNLLVLPLVPGLVGLRRVAVMTHELPGDALYLLGQCFVIWGQLGEWWSAPPFAVLSLFLMCCGVCTAVILWQARRVLVTVTAGNPFQAANGKSLTTAAVCCFLISAAALVRLLWRVWYYQSLTSLASYNALFVPLFFMGGLLCMVMSALFRQAYELKSENDLTI